MYKVLLVEDEEMIRKGLAFSFDWIKSDCVVVGEAANGVEGLKSIEKQEPDIVITDVGMPLKDGISMLKESIENYGYAAIILSVYDEFHYAKEALHLGVSEYLIKPLEHKQLAEALEKAKEQRRIRKHYFDSLDRMNEVKNQKVLKDELIIPQNIISRRVKKMIEYVENNYNKKIGMDHLVEKLQTSATYLNQIFKEETGYTFNDFLNRYRIQRAIALLKAGDHKVYNIAIETGFKDYKYFIQVFRKYTGMTPGKFSELFDHD